jgi:hypothetical protein
MDPKLFAAIDLLWKWVPRNPHGVFWPKEETLQGWFAAALVESGYATRLTLVLQELHLGEAKHDGKRLCDTKWQTPTAG